MPISKAGHDKTVLQRQVDAADNQIDNLVYELYDLTEEEIKIVEEGSKQPLHSSYLDSVRGQNL